MKYTKAMLGHDLKTELSRGYCIPRISRQSQRLLQTHCLEIDEEAEDILLELNTMEEDPRFEFTEQELQQLAHQLLSCNDS